MKSLVVPPPFDVPKHSTEQAQSPALLTIGSVYSDRVVFSGYSYGETLAWRRYLVYTFTLGWWKENGEPTAIGIPVDAKGNPTVSRHEVECMTL